MATVAELMGWAGGDDTARGSITARSLIPETVSPCALGVSGVTCVGKKTIMSVARQLGMEDTAASDPTEVIGAARKITGCLTEKCAVSAIAERLTGAERAHVLGDITLSYKVDGPTGTRLLTNFNIDSVLRQWAATRPDFFAYNFNMRDYASHSFANRAVQNTPDTLATVKWADLAARGIKRAACVINSDVYSGPGKHWMALFADATTDPPTVEFFNSSGSPPAAEWVNWLVKTRGAIDDVMSKDRSTPHKPTVIIKASSVRHQDSRSECGVYSVFYIWARLNGVPPSFFAKTTIPDKLMFEFRQHLFEDKTRAPVSRFDWDAFKATTRIEWE